jgi:hypothetical protein
MREPGSRVHCLEGVPGLRSIQLRSHLCRRCRTNNTVRDPGFGERLILAVIGVRRYRCRSCRRTFWSRPRRVPPPR